MSKTHRKGLVLPGPGDDILGSFEKLADTTGVITSVSSPAAARSILAQAEAEGKPATGSAPYFFNILGTLWSATGEKGQNGAFDLMPFANPDWGAVSNQLSGQFELSNGEYRKMAEIGKIPVRPYDRLVLAIGQIWGKNTQGKTVDLEVWVNGEKGRGRLGEWDENVMAMTLGVLPAETVPDISMWALGTPGGSKVIFSGQDSWSRFFALAFPYFSE